MSSGPYRLQRGGFIDRSQRIDFSFDGRALSGFEGDSLASALLANGVRTVARSFKFHRPRGVYAAGIEEPNALVQLHAGAHAIPSVRAPVIQLQAGLRARSQAGWPSVSFDLLRALDFAASLFAAGFYNKTFMWPSWHLYEPAMRELAGLGRTPTEPDPDRYEVRNLHCEVLVVGAGVAGLTAAASAAATGERVVLADQDTVFGGTSRWDGSSIEGVNAAQWLETTIARLQRAANVRCLPRTTAVGCYDHNVVTLIEDVEAGGRAGAPRERYWIVRPKRIVLATGAIEQPLVFCNNDRPGVMLAGAARRYLTCQAVAPGRRILIATNNDSAYALATELHAAGIAPLTLVDSRMDPPANRIADMRALGIPVHVGSMPVNTRGFGALSGVDVAHVEGRSVRGKVQRFDCDALLVSGGWSPALHLFAQAGGKLIYSDAARSLVPAAANESVAIVGAAAGLADSATIGPRISPIGSSSRQWIDLRHDVTVADIELAVRENFTAVEHVKRYTTVGMSVDQGKTSQTLALEVIAALRGCAPAQLGYTTMRPPVTPVTLGAIAGRSTGALFAPSRRSPLHDWHVAHGALMEDFGEWQRPAAYPQVSETRADALRREARAVRTAVGLFDASPLGKIEVHGPDAREFVDHFYINDFTALQPGRIRYGLMLRETGVIYDDGTVVALAQDRLLLTTTSGNAASVGAWLEEWRQCEWPQLRVVIFPVTDQWATITVAGPWARRALERLKPSCDLSNEAFPHFGLRETELLGTPVRICRVSFSGELSYEVSAAPDATPTIWQALMHEGRDLGITPYGVDAVLHLRMEKGFLHIGTDTDGTTVPDDVGWGRAAATKRRDFVGKRSLALPENQRADRLQLIGLTGSDGRSIRVGSHLRLEDSRATTDGWVTSAGRTILDDRPVALALLRGGRTRLDAEVAVYDGGRIVTRARVVSPPFVDPRGERMHA